MKKIIASMLTLIILIFPIVANAATKDGFVHNDKTNIDMYYENGVLAANK